MMRLLPLLLLFAAACAREEAPPRKLNLLVYLVDTLRSDHLGCYGYERDTSPQIDRLAIEGVLFENFHVQSNWTQPSVGSLITSQPPLHYGLEGFTNNFPESALTLAEILKQNGYRTGGFVTNTAVAPEFGFGQGFDVYKESGAELTSSERRKRLGAVFDADTLNDLALPWLEANAEGPFFLYMHSVDPHVPYMPPERFDLYYTDYKGDVDGSQASVDAMKKKRWKTDPEGVKRLVALYDGEIRFNDHEIGRLLGELERLGVLDDTLVVLVSDHGEELYDRGTSGHGHMNLHRELTRVPLILRLPGVIPAGRREAALASGLDLLPTVLDLLGIAAPDPIEGRSLAPLITGEGEPPAPPMLYAFRVKQVKDLGSLRTHEYLFLKHPGGKQELFNVRDRPDEKGGDLFPGLPDTGKRMWEKRLDLFRKRRAECEINLRARQGDETLDIPEELKERLRALGYLK